MSDAAAQPARTRDGHPRGREDAGLDAVLRAEATFPAAAAGREPRISPTVVSQFVRLDQCRRYLRLALHERSYGPGFLHAYHVTAQPIQPLLTRAGSEFEERVEAAAANRFDTRKSASGRLRGEVQLDNEEVVAAARELAPGQTVIMFQTRLRVSLSGWDFTGDADIVRFERDDAGRLAVLVADMKATRTAKIEHRLQVAFYREMLGQLLSEAGVEHEGIATGILYRGGATEDAGDEGDAARIETERGDARRLFNIDDAQLELIPDPEAYLDAVTGLVTGSDSVAARVASAPFNDIPWHLTSKCDGCLYNEFCMKWAAEHDDLSLLPHLSDNEKTALQRTGIAATRDLVGLLQPTTDPETGIADLRHLKPAPGQAALVRRVSRAWPVGPRLDELVHRARRYRRWKGDSIEALPYIPSKGYGSLPYSDGEHNPNLVRIFIDAQHDYLLDRLYLIGSLVVGNEAGIPDPARRRSVVSMTDAPPDETSERELLVRWIGDTIRAVAELAAPDEEGNLTAPIHLIFYNQLEQKLLLEALGRHTGEILAATPLYDFITQLAAFDSPVATFLDREIRELKNYPIVCQSLQAVASSARPNGIWFDWNAGEPYREIFRERMFDALGRFDVEGANPAEQALWSTRRSRFSSQIPLEYAYAAWGALPEATPGAGDPYAAYRRATAPLIRGFQARRLEALEHIASDFRGNRDTKKSKFAIPDLSSFDGKARGLAEALREFVTIERHVELAAWKAARLAPPERRVLSGHTLLVRYAGSDQSPGVLRLYAENHDRAAVREEQRARYLEAHPGAKQVRLSKQEKALSEPLAIDEPFRFRIDVADTEVSLDDALALSTFGAGDRVVLEPRWTTDSRLPAEEQTLLTPTPKQLLYGMRLEIKEIEVDRDSEGKATDAWLHLSSARSFASKSPPGYLFRGFETPIEDGARYTIDPDPNNIYGFWGAKVVEGLIADKRNTLFDRVNLEANEVFWPAAARDGQARFMNGLAAMHEAGAAVGFEPSKAEFIGDRGDVPLLLVQGPPGTGKSFTTAFAVLARLQGALAAEMPYRVLIGAKTHAATDVLLANILGAQRKLERMRDEQPEIFAEFFDAQILDGAVYRLQPREAPPPGVAALRVDDDQPMKAFDVLTASLYAIVASTPGGVYRAANEGKGAPFGHDLIDLLVLDEASQLSLPESIMAALPLKAVGQIIVVGDHRQMAPIVKHDWEHESRRTFQEYAVYRSLFDTVLRAGAPMIQFEQSFRLDRDMAEFLRRSVYAHDDLHFHSHREGRLRPVARGSDFVRAVLDPDYPLVVIVHDEAQSQLRNDFERDLTAPLLAALHEAGYRVRDGFGLVVPHRAQRANLQESLRRAAPGAEDPDEVARAVDTVERFQGGERDAIIVSATESDPAYLLAAGAFLYDPRRLTVAISRARDKMILVASRSVFDLFSPDEETFANARLWKDLLHRTCTVPLWEGEIAGQKVEVWGNPPLIGVTG